MINPGQMFINSYGVVESANDVLAYAEFLRKETGHDGVVPVDVDIIYNHFQIPDPIIEPINGHQGFLLDAKNGIVFINSTDPLSRQNFTKAHELVEILFSVLSPGRNLGKGWFIKKPGGFTETTKEYLCNWAAANLLMPPDFVLKKISQFGCTIECAKYLAEDCKTSLSASMVQIARISPGLHSVVLWVNKNKPRDLVNRVSDSQLSLFEDFTSDPAKKLRIEWSLGNPEAPFLPKNKSINEDSLIFKAWQSLTSEVRT